MPSHIIKSENGQGLMEYALILSLIALLVVGVLTAVGSKVVELYEGVK